MKDFRNKEVARNRCQFACPLCGSLCIYEINHNVNNQKHEAYHQPLGLSGVTWSTLVYGNNSTELIADSCASINSNTSLNKLSFTCDGKEYKLQQFPQVFPDWLTPSTLKRFRQDLSNKHSQSSVDIGKFVRAYVLSSALVPANDDDNITAEDFIKVLNQFDNNDNGYISSADLRYVLITMGNLELLNDSCTIIF